MKMAVFYHHVREAARQQEISISEMMSRVKKLGIDSIEIDLNDVKDSETLQAELQGMKISSVYGFYDWSHRYEEKEVMHHINIAKSLGADKIMVTPGFYSGERNRMKEERDTMIAAMKKAVLLARKYQIMVTIEDFDDKLSPIADAYGMNFFLEEIPELKVTFDVGNFFYSGETVLEAYTKLGSRVQHVHCKNRSFKKNNGEEKISALGIPLYPCAVGAGDLPMKQIIHRLQDHGYDGYYVIEHFGVEDYWQAICDSAKWLSKEIN
ncbi:hypothetical protein lbkm_3679 [Lachnospiraceae bacterium KM106-2]|nr:hypothetical protein lbkm_3679 [Lachnospiraceae bacterium KM106-2]